jgi:serine O-acetyltransferase
MRTNLIGDVFRDLHRLSRMGARPAEVALDPGAWAVATYRVGRKLRSLPGPIGVPLQLLHKPWERIVRLLTGVRLPVEAEIGGGLYLAHVGDISIAPGAHLGRDVNLAHGASIAEGTRDGERGAPYLGDRVYIGPGAKVLGPIRVGNDVAIAANAIVDRDVPDGASVGGAPAQVLSMQGSRSMLVRGRKPASLGAGLRAALRKVLPRPLPLLIAP